MFLVNQSEEVKRLIALTKSDSGVSGPELAEAHIALGRILGRQMHFEPKETTVVALMRGGIFFAQGIYFQLGCQFMTYDPKHEEFIKPNTKNIILADSVINTGKTVLDILEPGMTAACCVIQERAVNLFDERLFAVRVSKNSFQGSGVRMQTGAAGPDTTLRLFHLI